MVDYAPSWESLPRDSLHAAHEMPLSQVRNSAGTLAALLDENKDEQVLKEACLGLCQLFGEGIQNDRIQAILEANVVPKLVALLRPSKSRSVPLSVQSAALQVLGNVACGDDRQTQVVIDSDALPCLRALLSSTDRNIRKEVCWIVSNITESSHQVQDVLDADILPPLLKLLDNQDSACREDATWVLFNLSSNRDPNQIAYLAQKNGVRALCNLLTCSKELDVLWKGCGTVAAVALKGLRNILISGQIAAASDPNGYNKMASLVAEAHGVERIEALTTHGTLDVRTRARLLLERIFGAEPSTADLSPPLAPPSVTGLASLTSPPPLQTLGHPQCSCSCQQQHHQHHSHGAHQYQTAGMYDVSANLSTHGGLTAPPHLNHNSAVEHAMSSNIHAEGDLFDVPGSTCGSSTDSDPEDDDSDSDLIPPPPAPCTCVLCSDPAPLAEKRPRWKGSMDDADFHRKNGARDGDEVRSLCHFCSGGGRLGDGRAGLAAKLGRAVRLGHPHCLAILLSRMTWSQRAAATEAPALLHPGGGPPDGGVGSSLPAVILAAQLGKPECLGLLLRSCKPDLDVTHGKKRLTALAWAAHKGYMRCCRLLIEHGASPATKCGDGVTALHLAASGGDHITICKLLIDHQAPVNARSAKKQTPLCLAAQKGFVKVVQLLLEHGADPNNEDEGKYTPLHLSASNGFVSSVDLLLKAGARVDSATRKGITPLHYAVQGGHAAVVKLLISAGAAVNCTRKPLLLIAADDGNLEVVQILLDANARVDCKANITAHLDKDTEFNDYLTPLHLASSRNNQEVVELLLRRGANVNEPTSKSLWSALDLAVLNGHAECAVTLLQHGSLVTDNCKSVGRNNWTLVQHAANHGAKDVVRLLIQRLKEQGKRASKGEEDKSQSGVAIASDVEQKAVPISLEANVNVSEKIAEGVTRSPISGNHVENQELERPGNHAFADQNTCDHRCLTASGGDISNSGISHDSTAWNGNEAKSGASNGTKTGSVVHESNSKTSTSRRRVVKDDRQASIRARELRKREQEASEARDRLEEAIAQRSVTKLTDAITHVSKLVFHLTSAVGGDVGSGPGHVEYNDVNGYGGHGDSYDHAGHAHSSSGKHGSGSTPSTLSAPLPMEVGLGNEVQKARKILAGLLAEEKRQREEKEKEVADSRRENAQQTVRKATTIALKGGDPRSLSRATNRATRTILEDDDPVVEEAQAVISLIYSVEKWKSAMKTAVSESNLESLAEALPELERALSRLTENDGQGAAMRVFGGTTPNASLSRARALLTKLQTKREIEKETEAAARDLERSAQQDLEKAISSNDIVRLEKALDHANSALLSKESELSSAIEAGKKLFTKWLKAERRKLRQASNTNDSTTIENAAETAEQLGLQALRADIDGAKALAQKLRDQAEALRLLEEASINSDVAGLSEIKNKLNSLGMFNEAERAREEVERLQRATRARMLLEGAVKEAKEQREPIAEAFRESETASDIFRMLSTWTWPDAQRLCDLSDRARKYGQSLQSLCDSADTLAKDLAVLGRRILLLLEKSDDATAIASIIARYEKSFVNVSDPDIFDRAASEKAVAGAKNRLAEVQAMDQASVKAESAQVKVEYALATSRRSAARNKGSRTTGLKLQQESGNDGLISSPTSQGYAASSTEMRSPSSLSSDFVDDESSEVNTTLSGIAHAEGSSSTRASDVSRPVVEKRARVSSHQTDESKYLDTLGDESAVFPGDCSHFYLFKEGTTVCCARCGHLRSSSNPEWLARVKRRGNKIPPEVLTSSLSSLPSTNSGSDLQASFQAAQYKVQGRSPVASGVSHPMERNGTKSMRTPVSMPPPHHISQGLAFKGPAARDQSRASQSHSMVSGAPTPNVSRMMQVLRQQHPLYQQKMATGQQRGRGRPHSSQIPPPLGHHLQGMAGVYGNDVTGSPLPTPMGPPVSLPLPVNYASSSGLQGLPPMGGSQAQLRAYGMSGMEEALPGIDPKTVVRISQDMGMVIGINQHGMPVESIATGHGGSHQTMAGPHQGVNGPGGMSNVRTMLPDDVGGSGMDLGLDFANENFGFDIDAIVDDNPPPGPSKRVGTNGEESRGEVPKTFVPNARSRHNGFFQR